MAQTYRAADWAALVLGIVMVLIGLVLGAGGAWLLWLGGSFYYLRNRADRLGCSVGPPAR